MATQSGRKINYPGCINSAELNALKSSIENSLSNVKVNWDNVLIVAKTGGDYTKLTNAINFAYAQYPSATDPWLIIVMPGIYKEDITFKPYINVVGMGGESNCIFESTSDGGYILVDKCYVDGLTFSHNPPTTSTVTIACQRTQKGWIVTPDTPYHSNSPYSYYGTGDDCETWLQGFGLPSLMYLAGYITFDLSSLVGATIISATLSFYIRSYYTASLWSAYTAYIWFKRCLRVTGDEQLTWNSFATGSPWQTAPGTGALDYTSTNYAISDAIPLPAATHIGSYPLDVSKTASCTALVQDMVTSGTYTMSVFRNGSGNVNGWNLAGDTDLVNKPSLNITCSALPSSLLVCSSGTATVKNCTFTGSASLTKAITISGTGSLNVIDSYGYSIFKGISNSSSGLTSAINNRINSNDIHIENTGIGTVVSEWNELSGSGTHLKQSAGTLYSLADRYLTTSGTVTLLGNADMVDGYHASSFSLTTHNHDGVYGRWRGSAGSAPSDPLAMDVYLNTGDNNLYMYDSAGWRQIT